MAWAPLPTGETTLEKVAKPERIERRYPVCPHCLGDPVLSFARFTSGPKARLECSCGVVGEYQTIVWRHDPYDDARAGWSGAWRRLVDGIQSWKEPAW